MSTAEQAVSQHHHDDQSHYEISLTAGQAFIAFVLLLLSLAASFAFGLMIGRGQADERLIVRKEPAVVNEPAVAQKKNDGRIEELGVADDDFKAPPVTDSAPRAAATPAPIAADDALPVSIAEDANDSSHALPDDAQPAPAAAATPAAAQAPVQKPAVVATTQPRPAAAVPATPAARKPSAAPHYAQLLSTGDQKTAESLAAKLIDGGFPSAYVERGANEKGTIYRVRVKFPSESDARAAESRLKAFAKEVWITKQ